MRIRIAQVAIVAFISASAGSVCAETVVPLKGQSPEQIQADVTACKSQASSTETTTAPASTAQGGRLRGAAAGAAVRTLLRFAFASGTPEPFYLLQSKEM